MPQVSERERDLPELVIGKLLKLAAESKDIISLGPGEPDFKTPKPILDYAKKVIEKGTHYAPPAGRSDLREAIVRKLGKDNKVKTSPENIVVTTGSQEALFSALLCTIDPADQVLVPNPGYLGYIPTIELLNGAPVHVKLDEGDNFEINPDRIKEAIDSKKTKVLIINSPSNPTGTVLSRSILEEIADIAIENNLLIFSDEAYEKIIYERKHISPASLNGMENHVLTFQTFSKTYAMCGFRIGYVAAPKKIAEAIDKSHHYLTICASHPSQLIARKALELPRRYVDAMVKEYDRRRKLIVQRLNEIGLRTKVPYGAFYTFSNISHISNNSLKFADRLLKEAKVAVVPGTEFGKFGEGFIRCSYATDYRLIEKAMNKIEEFVKKAK